MTKGNLKYQRITLVNNSVSKFYEILVREYLRLSHLPLFKAVKILAYLKYDLTLLDWTTKLCYLTKIHILSVSSIEKCTR